MKFYKEITGIRNGDLIEYIKKASRFPVVFPYEELVEASRQDFVFFKTDHHWTDWGAFAGYQVLMNEIKKDFPYVNIANEMTLRSATITMFALIGLENSIKGRLQGC